MFSLWAMLSTLILITLFSFFLIPCNLLFQRFKVIDIASCLLVSDGVEPILFKFYDSTLELVSFEWNSFPESYLGHFSYFIFYIL